MTATEELSPAALAKENPRINLVEAMIASCPQVELKTHHVFTPGLYTRTMFAPKGTILTSKIHKTEHPFVISQGRALVYTEDSGTIDMQAPYMGVTKPGTRRVLEILEDCIWSTFHVTEKTDVDEIETDIIEAHDFSHSEIQPEEIRSCLG